MISICIPVYNNYVNNLVAALVSQTEKIQKRCEILLYDDGSDEKFVLANKALATHSCVTYFEAGENRGRIEARTALASLAQYNWLLFIDSDSEIIHDDFLHSYLNQLNDSVDVVVGGRVYSTQKPAVCHQTLHWKYGTYREKTDGRFVFMTNNFCIRKSLFHKLQFPQSLHGYGHEDTWMGIQLKQAGANLFFIQNEVLHAGVEEAGTFIKKSEQAIHNIEALEPLVGKRVLKDFIKLYRVYLLQKRWHLSWLVMNLERLFHKSIIRNLHSCNPNLWLFDFYRLVYLIQIKREKSFENFVVKED